ncbi:Aldehyde/histidinol dehydrogenase [Dioszegia hungarica]|uniref:Aldehyde dehydrogenase n=1 Tax=Dioszegia hungarica TaxID=4972 RepID=A0AA38HBP6_9TREE|nr:Aldehyde/histidinol dehydrogenase [Dioszegia hungarica]KAI9637190.1 Aldehyde/histidinol dehydrogenase [Dioszegia hungarica]
MSAQTDTPLGEIDAIFDRLKTRFASRATYSVDYRTYHLKQLGYMLKDNQQQIYDALKTDLDKGSWACDIEELYPIYNEIELAIRKLPEWMKTESRSKDAITTFKFISPRIVKQPKGVVLIIGPWNFPIQCVLIPLVNAIAAGCPVILKPSELSPAVSVLLSQLIPRYLDPEAYAVVAGGIEHATKLLEKEWGHIIYTGSTRVGRIVAAAAAKTLTPTTLELGGKSPVIVAECANIKVAMKRLLSLKQANIGQMCVSPDYILCVRSRVDELVSFCKNTLDEYWPKHPHPQSFLNTQATARLASKSGYNRQLSFLEHAEQQGTLIYRGETDEEKQRMGISLVLLDKGKDGGKVMQEEVFGPVLPIIVVEDLDEAIKYINDRPHPLALYGCTTTKKAQDRIIAETISGSLTFNDFGVATINRSLPFGGVGESGWGSYHGQDGFNTFTHNKPVLNSPFWTETIQTIRYPPLTPTKAWIARLSFLIPMNYKRPISVEQEYNRRKRRAIIRWLAIMLIGLSGGWFGLAAIMGRTT